MESNVKILFKFYSDALEEWINETIWTKEINLTKGHYRIDNIPFYAPFAYGDLVLAEFDKHEGMMTYKNTIEFYHSSCVNEI